MDDQPKPDNHHFLAASVVAERNFTLASRYALVIPVILSIAMCIVTGNWWFLLGIPISFLGGIAALNSMYLVYGAIAGAVVSFFIYGFNWKGYVFVFLIMFVIGAYFSRLAAKCRIISGQSQEIFKDNIIKGFEQDLLDKK